MAKQLERAYASYNRKYFGGQLPKIPVRWSVQIQPNSRDKSRRAYGWFTPGEDCGTAEGVILLTTEDKPFPERWRITLLHEMAHVKLRDHPEELQSTSDKHSGVWKKEMRRLAAVGAMDDLW